MEEIYVDGEPPTNDGIIFRRGFNSFEPLCEKTRQSTVDGFAESIMLT